jgi:hypothetical protein
MKSWRLQRPDQQRSISFGGLYYSNGRGTINSRQRCALCPERSAAVVKTTSQALIIRESSGLEPTQRKGEAVRFVTPISLIKLDAKI